MDVGLHTTLLDSNSILDPEVVAITERINPLMAKEFGKVWDLFTTRSKPFETDKFEVLNRNYTAPEIVITASGVGADWDTDSDITALPVTTGGDRIQVGDILLVESEIVVVKIVNSSTSIDLFERGAGESTAAAHGTGAITAKIIGNCNQEGTVNGRALAESTTQVYNCLQIIEEVIDLSKADTDQARKTGRTEDVLKSEAMERVMRKLARTSIFGTYRLNTADYAGMTRGMLNHMEQLSGAIKTAVSGAYTETALKNILDDVRAAGGTVNAIVMSVTNKRIFNSFTGADQIQVDRGERTGGHVLDGYIADGFGVIPAIVDIDFPNTYVAVVNTRYMSKGWKVNDQLKFVPETNVNSRERKETLQGKFGLVMEGVGKTHGLLTAIS
ncbi:MAG: DUF5309 family protein [Patescibacteria group bacterium]|nr:DUF5309 family protein [Patescibacteria group bacterium]